jgi:Bacteriophage clamp loader A subunit
MAKDKTEKSPLPPFFAYLDAITYTKKNIFNTEVSEKDYNAFQINRGLSLFPDTIMHANLMNRYSFLPNNMQHDFLFNSIRARKRYSKWPKPLQNDDIELIKTAYKYNDERANEALMILSDEQLYEIRKLNNKGGVE